MASGRLTDLLRKASTDSGLLKVPLRSLRDAILVNATTNGASSEEVRLLFSLFDGVHEQCASLQSQGSSGPYETVERALRLRLFLCVSGDTWKDEPGLRAMALRRLRRFAVEERRNEGETKSEAADKTTKSSTPSIGGPGSSGSSGSSPFSPGRVSVVTTKNTASAPSRLPIGKVREANGYADKAQASGTSLSSSLFKRAPSAVHSAVDVSSWVGVYGELSKVQTSRMLPVMSCLLDDLHDAERFVPIPGAKLVPLSHARLSAETQEKDTKTQTETRVSFSVNSQPPSSPAVTTPTQNFIEGWHRFDAPVRPWVFSKSATHCLLPLRDYLLFTTYITRIDCLLIQVTNMARKTDTFLQHSQTPMSVTPGNLSTFSGSPGAQASPVVRTPIGTQSDTTPTSSSSAPSLQRAEFDALMRSLSVDE